jgi:hypothetical protein
MDLTASPSRSAHERATRIRRTLSEHQPTEVREINMRSFLLIAAAVIAFGATMTVESTDANAVVCARGVYRAGCAGARGAVVVRRPPAVYCRWVWVGGVKIRKCG